MIPFYLNTESVRAVRRSVARWIPVAFVAGVAFGYFWAWKALGGSIQ